MSLLPAFGKLGIPRQHAVLLIILLDGLPLFNTFDSKAVTLVI